MNILNLIETLRPGGAEILIENNLTWLKKHTDWNLEVAVLFGSGEIADRLKRIGIRVHLLKLSNRFNFIEAILKIRKLLHNNNYDILHTHLFHANIYGRLGAKILMKNKPLIVTSFHNPDYSFEDNGRLTFKIRKVLDRWTYRHSNFTGVAVSKTVADDYQKHFSLGDIRVIYNSYLPLWDGASCKEHKAKKRELFGFDESVDICVTVARFSYQKAYDVYMRAIREITKKITKVRFLFIGEGTECDKIKELASKDNLLPYIIFLGRLDPERVKDYVGISDLFVLPSRFEAFGIAALEAMLVRVPVVVTETGGLKELITDGITGILTKPEDYKDLANKIIWALNNKEKTREMAENAYNRAHSYFSIDRTGYQWKEFYENNITQFQNKESVNR